MSSVFFSVASAHSVVKTPSFFTPHQTATQHNFPPTTCSPREIPSRNPNPPSATDAQTHLHSETDAASTSSTKKISAPSKPAVNRHPNIAPAHRSIRACRNQPAQLSKRAHPPQPDSIPSLPSAERYAPHRPTETTSHDASEQPQNSASASHPFAGSAHLAASNRRASQSASVTPSRCDRPTIPRYFRRARTADTAAKSPATACSEARTRDRGSSKSIHPKQEGPSPEFRASQTDIHAHKFSAPKQAAPAGKCRESRRTPR